MRAGIGHVLNHYFRDFSTKGVGWDRWSFRNSGFEGEIHRSKRIVMKQKISHDVSMYICVYMFVYICVCVRVCVYIVP